MPLFSQVLRLCGLLRFNLFHVIICVLFCFQFAWGQTTTFYEHGYEIGSFNDPLQFLNTFDEIYKDADGQLWMLNLHQILRYDGLEFETLLVKEEAKINNVARQFGGLTRDAKGNLWLASLGGGIVKYNPKNQTFSRSYPTQLKNKFIQTNRIADDPYGGIWAGYGTGILQIINGDSMYVNHLFSETIAPKILPYITELIESGNKIAGITKVPNATYRTQNFEITAAFQDLLVLAQGELDESDDVIRDIFLDGGWITNAQGDTVWKMKMEKSLIASRNCWLLRILAETISLPQGKYTLHYKTNDWIAYQNFWAYIAFGYSIAPDVPEWHGVQLFAIPPQINQEIESIWKTYPKKGDLDSDMTRVHKEADGTIWVFNQNLQKLIVQPDGQFHFEDFIVWDPAETPSAMGRVIGVCTKDAENLWVSGISDKGIPSIGILNKKTKQYSPIKSDLPFTPGGYGQNHFASLIQDHDDNLWIGRVGGPGLYRLSPPFIPMDSPGVANQITFRGLEEGSTLTQIKSLEIDDANNLWVGTKGNFFFKINLDPLPLQLFDLATYGISDPLQTAIYKESSDKIWIAGQTEDPNQTVLVALNPLNGEAIVYKDEFFGYSFQTLIPIQKLSDGRMLFFAGKDFLALDSHTQSLQIYPANNLPLLIPWEPPFMLNDSIIMGSMGSVFHIFKNKVLDHIDRHLFNLFPSPFTYLQDTSGQLFAMREISQAGFFRFQGDSMEVQAIFDQNENRITDALISPHGKVWISSIELQTDLDSTGFHKTINSSDGLPHVIQSHLLTDDAERIWMFNRNGVSRFNPRTGEVYVPYQLEDLSISQAFRHSDGSISLMDQDKNYMYLFHPDNLQQDSILPKIAWKSIVAAGEDTTQTIDISWFEPEENYLFPHDQSNITIRYKGIQFNHPKRVTYAYKLAGSSDEWQEVGTERFARFLNLSPGSYSFSLKAANADGFWSEPRSISFTVRQPWWWTNLAKAIYLLLAIGLIYVVYRFQLSRQLDQAEAHRLQELDQVKTRLYTNITHEFRTPLTVIQGMSEKVVEKPGKWLERGNQMIQRNSRQLLQLVNQMLDLSKLESGGLKLSRIQGDIIPFIYYLTESFHSFAEIQGVHLQMMPGLKEQIMDYDPDRITEIVTNLLSNAVKFTPENGQVSISTSQEGNLFCLRVQDSGIGIADGELPHIFDRFFQADPSATREGEGTGVGLALTRELVKLMEGSIEVESTLGVGTSFIVKLPITQHAHILEEGPRVAQQAVPWVPIPEPVTTSLLPEDDSNRPLVLLIEDSPDVVTYLQSCLEVDYRIAIAPNGQAGIEQAFQLVPDLVITDVMMPRKDGFEVCHELKQDIRTSHIPVIMLTARADEEAKLSGLRRGADAYLTKPFNEEELLVRVSNLLELRQRLYARYAASDSPPLSKETPQQELEQEDAFILQFQQVVADNLDNYDLDVPALCEAMGMSRSPLHNKLKALTGMSTTEFIRYLRLTKSKELLIDETFNIAEVSYQVGFQDPNYFTRKFRELFGVTPKAWREEKDERGS